MTTIQWQKSDNNPLPSLAPEPGTWRESATMTVDVLSHPGHFQIYYVGKKGGQDSIGVATSPLAGFNGESWIDHPDNPILAPGPAGTHDCTHVVDPAAVEFGGRVLLYYSALGDGPDSIGLAISEDGLAFERHERPVLQGRAPEVVLVDKSLHLLYCLDHPNGGYAYHLATSTDGFNFEEQGVVFTPAGSGWDGFSIVTPRIFRDGDLFVMAYAGDDEEKDYPKKVGLAFSRDLRSWTRYPENPVFSGGAPGSWDWRAIWFPEIFKLNDHYFLWYEGYNGETSMVGLARSHSPITQIGRDLLGI